MSTDVVDSDSATSTSSSSMDHGKRNAPPGGDFDGPHGTAALVKDAYGASWLLQVICASPVKQHTLFAN